MSTPRTNAIDKNELGLGLPQAKHYRDLCLDLENEAAKWKRLYENTVVQKEGMELYDEIKRLSNRVYELENIIKKGVWPK